MNGAEALVHTLLDAGVDTVFTHGGTPPEPLAAALERIAGMRCVPGLSEGVVIGAADGYHRLRQRPAGTRLQQGSGWAPLHHAGKARSGIVHLVGEHDTPSTTEDLTRSAPHWVRTIGSLPGDARAAVIEARHRPGRVATLVLPADLAASPMAPAPARLGPVKEAPAEPIDERQLVAIADQLRQHGPRTLLLLGGRATQARATAWAGKIAAATGCALMAECHAPRLERGAGRVAVPRLPCDARAAQKLLARFDHTVLVQSVEPVARLADPGTRSPRWLSLCSPAQDAEEALHLLCEALAASRRPMATVRRGPTRPHGEEGPLNPDGIGALLAALIPEDAIVVDEALANGRAFDTATREAAPHEWLPAVGGPSALACRWPWVPRSRRRTGA